MHAWDTLRIYTKTLSCHQGVSTTKTVNIMLIPIIATIVWAHSHLSTMAIGGCKYSQGRAAYQRLSPGMRLRIPGHAQPGSGHQPICCHSPMLLISLCVWPLCRAQVPLRGLFSPVHQCSHDAGTGMLTLQHSLSCKGWQAKSQW